MSQLKRADTHYKKWLGELKLKIRSVQVKAAVAVNKQLIAFYWELGKMIAEKQTAWGTQFLERLSKDLQAEFPEMKGFSVTNLKYCKLFFNYFPIRPQAGDVLHSSKSPQPGDEIAQHPVAQIPWGHIKLIIGKIKDFKVADFYIQQTIENNWSRDVLALQIKSNLYKRQGKAISNFKNTCHSPHPILHSKH